ncbi:MAG: hypothetical protein KDC71_14090, partial [Acidobacteria bacterium]|nr:hypothetical protein [Acidobacteriota bacterium]
TVGVQSENILRPGMYVDVAIILKTIEDATLVPKRALVFENEQTYVYRLKDDDTVERLAITPILADTLNIQPDAHIQPGDTIVVAGQTGLKNGAAVQVLQTDSPALAGQAE